jgi:Rrf2 family protein
MAYMSTIRDELPIRAKDLSEVTGIPGPYLSKIMRHLVTAGLLNSQKGRGGGFIFSKPLSKIRFIDVLNAVGNEIKPDECVFGWGVCVEGNPCPVHFFWSDFKEHFVPSVEKYTLADVVDTNPRPRNCSMNCETGNRTR